MAKAIGVDISALPETGITYDVPVIFDDDGEPLSGFRIVGKNSPEYRAQANINRAKALQRGAKKRTAIDASTERGAAELADLIDTNDRSLVMSVVVGWFGFTSGGKEAPFDKAMVANWFDKYPTWADKVAAELEKDANFMKV